MDVIVTIRPDDQRGRSKWATETILSGIPVLTVASAKPKEQSTKDNEPKIKGISGRTGEAIELGSTEAAGLMQTLNGDIQQVTRSHAGDHSGR